MRQTYRESEAKFLVGHREKLQARLVALGAELAQPRIYEINHRFDTPDRVLTREGRVLRLRRDSEFRLTYKDPGRREAGFLSRREIEFSVSDFDSASELLLALGYEIVFSYEKYRTTYAHQGVQFMLDELPYGNFVEIEGAGPALKPAAEMLGLKWEASIPRSYHDLFEDVRRRLKLPLQDLTFPAFAGIRVTPQNIGAELADVL